MHSPVAMWDFNLWFRSREHTLSGWSNCWRQRLIFLLVGCFLQYRILQQNSLHVNSQDSSLNAKKICSHFHFKFYKSKITILFWEKKNVTAEHYTVFIMWLSNTLLLIKSNNPMERLDKQLFPSRKVSKWNFLPGQMIAKKLGLGLPSPRSPLLAASSLQDSPSQQQVCGIKPFVWISAHPFRQSWLANSITLAI